MYASTPKASPACLSEVAPPINLKDRDVTNRGPRSLIQARNSEKKCDHLPLDFPEFNQPTRTRVLAFDIGKVHHLR